MDCLECKIQVVPIDFDSIPLSGDVDFHCLAKAQLEGGIMAEIPYQVELTSAFVDEHINELRSGLWTVCIPGGRAIRFPNSTVPDQVVIPEGSNLRLLAEAEEPLERSGNRTVLVVRLSGTSESPEESVDRMKGAVFGVGSQPLRNSMRAQYGRCSFSKIDFIPASGFDELDDGVMNIAMQYSLRGRDTFQVVNDAIRSVAEDLGVNSLNTT